MEVETSFFRVNIEDFNHFKLISFIIKKEKPTEEEWNNFITHTKMFYRDMAEKYVLICELSELGFIGIKKIREYVGILKSYPENIENYTIETIVILDSSVMKSLIKMVLGIYPPRRPYRIENDYDVVYDGIKKLITNSKN
jgi:hypothetical protein